MGLHVNVCFLLRILLANSNNNSGTATYLSIGLLRRIRVPETGDSGGGSKCIEKPIPRIFDFWKFMSTRNALLVIMLVGYYSIAFSQNCGRNEAR